MLVWTIADCAPGLALRFTVSPTGLRSIDFDLNRPAIGDPGAANPLLEEAIRQLRAYFAGDLRDFTIPLDMQGTEFQLRVWNHLNTIPYGEIRSYSQVAGDIGSPKAVRAVGAANGANPIPIIVPCHRVIGSSGKLVGYGGGLPLKERLLRLEGFLPPGSAKRAETVNMVLFEK